MVHPPLFSMMSAVARQLPRAYKQIDMNRLHLPFFEIMSPSIWKSLESRPLRGLV
jgi:hypothetical protein